ncbi:MAG: hypothetical protein JW682_00185 [Campylobacterales bacterium]|nr:hypothetical protein [Campylobacterales bacterium]HEO97735.1 hypothetical protein [Campylobacterota bacterium]
MSKHFKLGISLFIAFAVTAGTLYAEEKRYEVKSGVVEYAITKSGNMMGITMQGNGTAKTLFTAWGNVELYSEEGETTTMGRTEHEREMTKVDHGKLFVVDFDQKVIYEYTPEMLKNSEYQDFAQTGKEMIESMGGQKIGEERVMGYLCEVWEIAPVKLWLHKGVMLKSEAEMMGIKHTTIATKVNLNVSISESDLKLPDFPIKSPSENMIFDGEENENEIPQLTPEQMQQMQEIMKNFSAS